MEVVWCSQRMSLKYNDQNVPKEDIKSDSDLDISLLVSFSLSTLSFKSSGPFYNFTQGSTDEGSILNVIYDSEMYCNFIISFLQFDSFVLFSKPGRMSGELMS